MPQDDKPSEELLIAGDAFRQTLIPRADWMREGYYPMWHGWALMDAFIAGAKFATPQTVRVPPGDPLTQPGDARREDRAPASADSPQEGHGEPCYWCKEPCDGLAADPGRWPIALCHRDDPGVVKWHHERCVSERLIENQPAPSSERSQEPDGWAVLFMPGTEHFCYVGIWTKKEIADDMQKRSRGGDTRVAPMFFAPASAIRPSELQAAADLCRARAQTWAKAAEGCERDSAGHRDYTSRSIEAGSLDLAIRELIARAEGAAK